MLQEWKLDDFLSNVTNFVLSIGKWIVALGGAALIIYGIVCLIQKLMFHKNPEHQTKSWILIIAMLAIGGVCLFGGIVLFLKAAQAAEGSLSGWGSSGAQSIDQIRKPDNYK